MSDKIKDSISNFHDNDICWETSTIKIFGDIDFDMKDRVLTNLYLLDQKTSPITILLSSGGGCVTSGFEIIDCIRSMKNNVKIIAYGQVASMATVIFQAADSKLRLMMPNSYLMLHEGESVLSGKSKDVAEWKKLQDKQESKCLEIYLKRIREKKPRYKKEKLIKNLDKDWILFPSEAIELGLADEILENF